MTNEVKRLGDKFSQGLFPLFVKSISIDGLRGFKDTQIDFHFPVTAIVGENGCGKTTILKALACGYEQPESHVTSFNPGRFFPRTPWDSVENVQINYDIKNGNQNKRFKLNKPTERWRGLEKRPKRDVHLFDISRTMPIDALVGYAQVTKKQVQESRTEVLSNSQKTSLSDILGKHFRSARFASPDVDEEKRVGVLGRDFGEYSQFHQGAGESATLDLIGTLEPIKANALILIDEIEASLHPKAQRRLIKAILKLARKNAWQIVISTHSPYILEQLPPEARVLLMRTDKVNVVYRSSPEFCLSSLDEKNYPELTIFVEDREAQTLLREILRRFAPDASKRCEIYPVGPVNVVNTLGNLSQREKLPYKSIGVVDGGEETQSCWTLPGMAPPERLIFGELYQAGWPEAVHRFGLGAGELHAILEDAMLAEDHHDWTIRAGDELQRSRHFVWETLSELWVKHVAKEERISALREAVESRLQE